MIEIEIAALVAWIVGAALVGAFGTWFLCNLLRDASERRIAEDECRSEDRRWRIYADDKICRLLSGLESSRDRIAAMGRGMSDMVLRIEKLEKSAKPAARKVGKA